MYGFMRCFDIQLLHIQYLTHRCIYSRLINSSANIHIHLLPHSYQQHHQPPNSTVYIIMLINDGANYLLVHCSESNEEHR